MSKQILVTGGSGFIGSSFSMAMAIRHPDWEIYALDNLKRRGSELNISRLVKSGVTFIHGDIRNREDIDNIELEPDLIIECSAEPSVLNSYKNPYYVLNSNLIGCINCLELASRYKSDFIFLSTSRVYPISLLTSIEYEELETRFELSIKNIIQGISNRGVSEEFPLNNSRTLYGTSKLAAELIINEYSEIFGLRFVINRCGVIAGPWQMGKSDQGIFALWMLSHYFNNPLQYIGFGAKGKQVRDVLHIDDLVNLLEIQISSMDKCNGEIYNVGGGHSNTLSLLETTEMCRKITGNTIPIEPILENRQGDIPIYISDINKVVKSTGWKPEKGVDDVLYDIYKWVDEYQTQIRDTLL
jgi:CDP-paratose 2-epimerase